MKLLNIFKISTLVLFGAAAITYLVYGEHGFFAYQKTQQELHHKQHEIALLKQEIQKLDTSILAWDNDDYEKEAHARTTLCMSGTHELVYLIKPKA